MSSTPLRIGIVGLGANTRLRHVPGLRACPDVEIVSVCNRRPESTQQAAAELNIPRTFARWQDLVADPGIDAVVIGTWPFLHAPITLAALNAGKHVLTEARMAATLAEARAMDEAHRAHPQLVAQIVPSPFGLTAHKMMLDLLRHGFLGELREVVVLGTSDLYVDANAPLHWRQTARYSGINMLTLGILHETVSRWIPEPCRVLAQTQIFTQHRLDPETQSTAPVETPDSVHVLTQYTSGARGLYHFSAVTQFGPGAQIHFYGTQGTLKYELAPTERLLSGRPGQPALQELMIPAKKKMSWNVEADFVDSIRKQEPVELTNFAAGVKYMEFTEAVARSARQGQAIGLPLVETEC